MSERLSVEICGLIITHSPEIAALSLRQLKEAETKKSTVMPVSNLLLSLPMEFPTAANLLAKPCIIPPHSSNERSYLQHAFSPEGSF